jgi:hypothetical protein
VKSDYISYVPVLWYERQNRRRRELAKKTIDVLVSITMLLITLPSALNAQQQPEPKPLRFDFTPFIGYRTSMSFPVEPHVTGMNPRVVLDASPGYGVSFGVRLKNEDDLVEIRWARQDSYVHAENITPHPLRQRVILDQFHGDFSHEPLIEDWVSWARPFVLASLGATHISSSTNINSKFQARKHLLCGDCEARFDRNGEDWVSLKLGWAFPLCREPES